MCDGFTVLERDRPFLVRRRSRCLENRNSDENARCSFVRGYTRCLARENDTCRVTAFVSHAIVVGSKDGNLVKIRGEKWVETG